MRFLDIFQQYRIVLTEFWNTKRIATIARVSKVYSAGRTDRAMDEVARMLTESSFVLRRAIRGPPAFN